MLRTTLAVSRRTALTASLAAATAVLLSCGGGDETGPAPMYASLDLVGSWEFVTFRTGVAVGWERGIAAIDPAGVVSLTSFTDSAGTVDPGAQQDVLSISPATGELTGRSGGVPTTFHGTLARSKKLLAAVTPEAATYSLMFARKREVTTYSNADLRANVRAPLPARLRAARRNGATRTGRSTPREWSRSGSVMGPGVRDHDRLRAAAPPRRGARSRSRPMALFRTAARSAASSPPTRPRWSRSSPIRPADRPRTSSRSSCSPATPSRRLTSPRVPRTRSRATSPRSGTTCRSKIDALGSGHYVAPCLDSAGGTTLPPSFVTVLASNGRMTQAVNPSYRATLSTNGELYVRTTTHNPPGRYGIGVAFRR